MAILNEAFAVLSDAGRRAAYNRQRKATAPAELDLSVLAAARSVILKSNWKVIESLDRDFVFGCGKKEMFVRLIARADEAALHTWIQDTERLLRRRSLGLAVLLANKLSVRTEQIPRATLRNRIPVIAIDLTQARCCGSDFPDPQCRLPFEPFLRHPNRVP
jgi:hypothetical protein